MRPILAITEMIKEKYPNTHITMGGHMATFWGKEILERYPYVDSVIQGEGEITSYELVQAIEKNDSFESIDGLSYQVGDAIFENKDRELLENLDELNFLLEINSIYIIIEHNTFVSVQAEVA